MSRRWSRSKADRRTERRFPSEVPRDGQAGVICTGRRTKPRSVIESRWAMPSSPSSSSLKPTADVRNRPVPRAGPGPLPGSSGSRSRSSWAARRRGQDRGPRARGSGVDRGWPLPTGSSRARRARWVGPRSRWGETPFVRRAAPGCPIATARSTARCTETASSTEARSRASWSGWHNSAHSPLPMRFVVVSKPAAKSRMAVETTSSWVSRSEPSETAMSSDNRSSAGCRLRSAIRVSKYCSIDTRAARAPEVVEGRDGLEDAGGGAARGIGIGDGPEPGRRGAHR